MHKPPPGRIAPVGRILSIMKKAIVHVVGNDDYNAEINVNVSDSATDDDAREQAVKSAGALTIETLTGKHVEWVDEWPQLSLPIYTINPGGRN